MYIVDHILKNFANFSQLTKKYTETPPYPNIGLENFLPTQTISAMKNECNNLEWTRKFTRNGSFMQERHYVDDLPVANEVKNSLSSQLFLKWLGNLTGYQNLIPDPYMIGAGYMRCGTGHSLKIHSDFNFNNTLKLYRLLSLNIYLNDNWQEKWNGDLQFWDFDRKECVTKYFPNSGLAVIFEHHKRGYHGHPNALACPKNVFRDGFRMFYYVSQINKYKVDEKPHRSLYWYNEDTKQPYDITEQE